LLAKLYQDLEAEVRFRGGEQIQRRRGRGQIQRRRADSKAKRRKRMWTILIDVAVHGLGRSGGGAALHCYTLAKVDRRRWRWLLVVTVYGRRRYTWGGRKCSTKLLVEEKE
jgi:hypothetical protein